MTRRPSTYPPELRERAVRMVAEVTPTTTSQWAAISAVAEKLGSARAETVRKWVRQAEIDGGVAAGDDQRGVRGAQAAASGRTPSCGGPTRSSRRRRLSSRPSSTGHRDAREVHRRARRTRQRRAGVGCRADLRAARRARLHRSPRPPTTTPAVRGQPPPAALRDEELTVEIARVHAENYGVYGARKVWLALNREGIAGRPLHGRAADARARAGRRPRAAAGRAPPSPTRRRCGPRTWSSGEFNPPAPNRLWVADFTYVPTWSGMVYVAFVIDAYSRRILGWRAATTMRTSLVLDALEQAVWTRAQQGRDRPDRADRPQRRRVPIHLHRLHRAPRRSRRRPLGRLRRRRLRQRAGRVDHRAVQDRADQAARPVAHRRAGRDRHPGMGRLVQPPPPAQRRRRHPTRRARGRPLPSTPAPPEPEHSSP